MEILEKKIGNVCIVTLGGRLDAYASSDVEQKLNALVDAAQVCLVVSLEALEYISSCGLRVFLASLKKVRKREGDIKLACMKLTSKKFSMSLASANYSRYMILRMPR